MPFPPPPLPPPPLPLIVAQNEMVIQSGNIYAISIMIIGYVIGIILLLRLIIKDKLWKN